VGFSLDGDPGVIPAARVSTTLGELLRWTRALHAGRILARSTLALMTTPVAIGSGIVAPSGLGVALGHLDGRARAGQPGLYRYADEDVTVLVLADDDPAVGPLGDLIARAVFAR
jgi:hypothetical protein